MKAHLINLDRDTDRLVKFRRVNSHITDIVRFSAADGRRLDRQKLNADGWITPELEYSNAALGSATSHVNLWFAAVRERNPITIAEDDAVLSFSFEERAGQVLSNLPADWDIIKWGWNFDAYLWVDMIPGVSPAKIQFNQSKLRENLDVFQRLDIPRVAFKLLHGFGMMCYSISPQGAKAMLDICLPLAPTMIKFPGFDVVLKNKQIDFMVNGAYPKLKAFVAIPPLAVSENRHETSTIVGHILRTGVSGD